MKVKISEAEMSKWKSPLDALEAPVYSFGEADPVELTEDDYHLRQALIKLAILDLRELALLELDDDPQRHYLAALRTFVRLGRVLC